MTDFNQTLRTYFEGSRGHPQFETWLDYALSTNIRGGELVEKLRHWVPDFSGKRTLDVGSGYGGTAVAMALAGANATGVEIDTTLLGFSQVNAQDHPGLSVKLSVADAMDWSSLEALGTFDVITFDNVVEHVPVPQVAIAHLRRLVEKDGLIWLTAPNAFSFGQIRSECHYGQFGLSLLDPFDGSTYVNDALNNPAYEVSEYFTFDSYVAMFGRYGLHAKLLNPVDSATEEVANVRAQRNGIEDSLAKATIPVRLKKKVQMLLSDHLSRCDADLSYFDMLPDGPTRESFGHRLFREYCTELWYFALSPTPERVL
jgi:2-polyprenyl-3-methyl-5-hydroxy-6-metoxy-1,4-benzoquinol methylase